MTLFVIECTEKFFPSRRWFLPPAGCCVVTKTSKSSHLPSATEGISARASHLHLCLRGTLNPISHCFVQQEVCRRSRLEYSYRTIFYTYHVPSSIYIRIIRRLLLSRAVFVLHGISSASRHHAYIDRQSVLHYNHLGGDSGNKHPPHVLDL